MGHPCRPEQHGACNYGEDPLSRRPPPDKGPSPPFPTSPTAYLGEEGPLPWRCFFRLRRPSPGLLTTRRWASPARRRAVGEAVKPKFFREARHRIIQTVPFTALPVWATCPGRRFSANGNACSSPVTRPVRGFPDHRGQICIESPCPTRPQPVFGSSACACSNLPLSRAGNEYNTSLISQGGGRGSSRSRSSQHPARVWKCLALLDSRTSRKATPFEGWTSILNAPRPRTSVLVLAASALISRLRGKRRSCFCRARQMIRSYRRPLPNVRAPRGWRKAPISVF